MINRILGIAFVIAFFICGSGVEATLDGGGRAWLVSAFIMVVSAILLLERREDDGQ